MIDLRSDTCTRPSMEMRDVMCQAEVGDDVYGDDPSINELEARSAFVLEKEAAIFMPSGTMANQVAIRVHCDPGDCLLAEAQSHIINIESGGVAVHSGVSIIPISTELGWFSKDDVAGHRSISLPFIPAGVVQPVRLVWVENTHNAAGGTVWPTKNLREVGETAAESGMSSHLDGARIWNASQCCGVSPGELARPFDSVSACFSKGLGAPVGSILAGSETFIQRTQVIRRLFGGAMRQAGILGAAALFALENHQEDLSLDHENARRFSEGISEIPSIELRQKTPQSNIVRFQMPTLDAIALAVSCHDQGLYMLPTGPHSVRAVFYRDISSADVDSAVQIIDAVVRSHLTDPPSS